MSAGGGNVAVLVIGVVMIAALVLSAGVRIILAVLLAMVLLFMAIGVISGCTEREEHDERARRAFFDWLDECESPVFYETEHDPNNVARQGFIAECLTKEKK